MQVHKDCPGPEVVLIWCSVFQQHQMGCSGAVSEDPWGGFRVWLSVMWLKTSFHITQHLCDLSFYQILLCLGVSLGTTLRWCILVKDECCVFCVLFFLGSDVSRLMTWSSAGWLQVFLCYSTIYCWTSQLPWKAEMWCVRGWALPISAAGWGVPRLCLELGRDPDHALTCWLY